MEGEADLGEVLVEHVRTFPCLWDVGSRSYRDRNRKEQAWVNILREVQKAWPEQNAQSLKKLWKRLRDYYVKEKKKLEEKKKSGSAGGSAIVSSWGLFNLLDFLRDTVVHRTTATNFNKAVSCCPSPVPSSRPASPGPGDEEDLCSSQQGCEEDDGAITPPPASPLGSDTMACDDDDHVHSEQSLLQPQPATKKGKSPRPDRVGQAAVAQRPAARKRKRSSAPDDVELEIVQVLKDISAQRKSTEQEGNGSITALATTKVLQEEAFCRMVGETLQRFSPQESAVAKLRIHQVLLDVEFPGAN